MAYHLGIRLKERGLNIVEVYSRTAENTTKLANELGVKATLQIADLEQDSDLYILAISDDAIEEVALELSKSLSEKSCLVHTSGVTPSSIFEGKFQNFGVFYPLQSFSKSKSADFENIPICVDASDENLLVQLEILAHTISPKVYKINDEQRAYLHLAAVYANNFTNYLFHVAHQILEQRGIPFDLVRPLILETAQKIQQNAPKLMQTGPAIRGDEASMQRHLKLLENDVAWKQIYDLLSKRIEEEIAE